MHIYKATDEPRSYQLAQGQFGVIGMVTRQVEMVALQEKSSGNRNELKMVERQCGKELNFICLSS